MSFLPTLRRATAAVPSPVVWTYLPQHLPYSYGLTLQETLVARRLAARKSLSDGLESASVHSVELERLRGIAGTDILLLLQHTPVYTAGRREKDAEVARLEGERLGKLGADYVSTMRGGQTTYHGPGQLVGYPILDLGNAQLSTRCYVDRLEKFLAHLTTELGVDVYPLPHTGVFTSPTAKIGSIGIHVRRRITLHGFSLNIEDQVLDWFNHIVACGLDEVKATSVQTVIREEETSKKKGGMKVGSVVDLAVRGFGEAYGRRMEKLGSAGEHEELIETIRAGTRGKLPLLGPLAV